MDFNELLRVIRRRPFEPFRIHVSDGSLYDVTHPNLCILAQRALHIGVRGRAPGVAERVEIVGVVHITRIEPLAGAATG